MNRERVLTHQAMPDAYDSGNAPGTLSDSVQTYLESIDEPDEMPSDGEVAKVLGTGQDRASDQDIGDPFSIYLREISRRPLLTAEEEVRLAKQLEAGKEAYSWLSKNGIALPKPQTDAEAFDEGNS